jgi:hypothetical protein
VDYEVEQFRTLDNLLSKRQKIERGWSSNASGAESEVKQALHRRTMEF